jgi:hypothetical protein
MRRCRPRFLTSSLTGRMPRFEISVALGAPPVPQKRKVWLSVRSVFVSTPVITPLIGREESRGLSSMFLGRNKVTQVLVVLPTT